MAATKKAAEAGETKVKGTSVKEEFQALQEKIADLAPGDDEWEKTLKEFKAVSVKYYNERVKVKLPRPRAGEDKHVYVGVNGIGYLIERGKEVEVLRSVAEVLERSEAIADENFESQDALSRSFTDDPRTN